MANPIPEEKMAALSEFIFRGRKIEAIKLYRELTGVGLKEAKDEVEAIETSLQKKSPEKFVSGPKGKGCFGTAVAFCLVGVAIIFWIARK